MPLTIRECNGQDDSKPTHLMVSLKFPTGAMLRANAVSVLWDYSTLKLPPSQMMSSPWSDVQYTHLRKQEIYSPRNHEHVNAPASPVGKLESHANCLRTESFVVIYKTFSQVAIRPKQRILAHNRNIALRHQSHTIITLFTDLQHATVFS